MRVDELITHFEILRDRLEGGGLPAWEQELLEANLANTVLHIDRLLTEAGTQHQEAVL